jgi:hypothetical protein
VVRILAPQSARHARTYGGCGDQPKELVLSGDGTEALAAVLATVMRGLEDTQDSRARRSTGSYSPVRKDNNLGSGARHQPERLRQQEERRQQHYLRREAARKRVGGRRCTITIARSGLSSTTSSLSAHSEHSSRSDTGKSHILQRIPPR